MARKLGVKSYLIIAAGDMSGDITSEVSNVENVDNIGYFVQWTSSDAVGVLSVQGSINYDPHLGTGNWVDLTFDPALDQPTSNNGSYLININQFPYPWIRLAYASTSGDGVLNVWVSTKSVGA